MSYRYLKKHIPLRALTVSLADVKRIFERLSAQLEEEADRQARLVQRPPNQDEDDFQTRLMASRRNAFRITVTIGGADGQDLFSDRAEIFASPNLPDSIGYIFMTNTVAYQGETGRMPPNRFSFNLDFGKRPLIDNPVSDPTPNNSNLTVEGDRDAWVSSVQEAVMGVLQHRKTGRGVIHTAHVYDAGLLLIGIPFALYLCWRAGPFAARHIGETSSFLSSAFYLYLGLAGIWAYRILFGYTKWAFPSVELRENEHSSRKHRAFWSAIVLGIVTNFAYEFLRSLN